MPWSICSIPSCACPWRASAQPCKIVLYTLQWRKSLGRGEADSGFSMLWAACLAAELMEYGSFTQGETQAKRLCDLLRQGHCFLAPCQRLVRISKIPQCPGDTAETRHTNIFAIEERRGTVLLGIVECYTLGKCVCAEATAPMWNNVTPRARCAAIRIPASWTPAPGRGAYTQCLRRLQLGTHVIIIHSPRTTGKSR